MVPFSPIASTFVTWVIIDASKGVAADVRLANVPQGARGFNDTCIRVLNQAVNCDQSLIWADGVNNFYDQATISTLCSEGCKTAMDRYLEEVKSACETSRYDGADGLIYHGGYSAEVFWEKFNILCLTNSASDNCNLVLGELAGINPQNQLSTATADPNIMCNDCALSAIKTQLEMPLASNADLASGLSAIASSCHTTISISALPSASPPWIESASVTATTTAPTAASSCAGATYAMKNGDTCQSVSQQQRIDTVQLLAANHLLAGCTNFPSTPGSELCIPSELVCEPYTVNSGDTCTTIANSVNATWAQIVAWNQELGSFCQNVAQYVDYVVCVSSPGGSWVNPGPSTTTSVADETTASADTIFTLSMTPILMSNAYTTMSVSAIWADDEL